MKDRSRLDARGNPWLRLLVLLVVTALLLTSCTATQSPAPEAGEVPGFLLGFWHGLIAPIAFIVSVFSGTVRIYAFPNSGIWYDLGFMLGIGGFSGGVFAGSRGQGRERKKA